MYVCACYTYEGVEKLCVGDARGFDYTGTRGQCMDYIRVAVAVSITTQCCPVDTQIHIPPQTRCGENEGDIIKERTEEIQVGVGSFAFYT